MEAFEYFKNETHKTSKDWLQTKRLSGRLTDIFVYDPASQTYLRFLRRIITTPECMLSQVLKAARAGVYIKPNSTSKLTIIWTRYVKTVVPGKPTHKIQYLVVLTCL